MEAITLETMVRIEALVWCAFLLAGLYAETMSLIHKRRGNITMTVIYGAISRCITLISALGALVLAGLWWAVVMP